MRRRRSPSQEMFEAGLRTMDILTEVLESVRRLDPTGPHDGFCTCPSCGLLGTHHVEPVGTARQRCVSCDLDLISAGQTRCWLCDGQLEPVPGLVRRRCVFCEHAWTIDYLPAYWAAVVDRPSSALELGLVSRNEVFGMPHNGAPVDFNG